jgi:23S rRNA G2069 N7-methylase RlmK/C1962 C5-methylase RlmI
MTKIETPEPDMKYLGNGLWSRKRRSHVRMLTAEDAERLKNEAAEALRLRRSAQWRKFWVQFGILAAMVLIASFIVKIFT